MNFSPAILPCTLLICLFACGGNNTSKSSEPVPSDAPGQYLTAVLTKADLPTCNADIEGRVIYTKEEAIMYSCLSNTWEGVKSSKGENGKECTLAETKEGVEITCGDEAKVVKNGIDGNNGSDGTDGDKGDRGDSGHNSLPKLYDANGDLIGIVGEAFATTGFTVWLTPSGFNVAVESLATGFKVNVAADFKACFYLSNDCSGTCYLNTVFATKPGLRYGGVLALPILSNEILASTLVFESFGVFQNSPTAEYCDYSCTNCSSGGGYGKVFATSDYDPPKPFQLLFE